MDVLVDNALRHGSGTVSVSLFDDGDHVEIRVGDQGRGRPGNEVFHRSVGSDGAGLGIGLTVAAEIAEALGGRLTLADTPPRPSCCSCPGERTGRPSRWR